MAIDVRIAASPSGGLQVIPHIPPFRPCRLEGRNGIGKSTAIRLLALIAGGQPFANDPGGWGSFRSNIGAALVTLTGLDGATEITVRLTPDLWPVQPELLIGDEIGAVTIDGAEADVEHLRRLFDVRHLSGTERLVDTLKRRVDTYGSALSSVQRRLNGLNDQRTVLENLAAELEFVSPAANAADRDAAQELERRRTQLSDDVDGLSTRLMNLHKAAAYQAMLSSTDADSRAAEIADLVRQANVASALVAETEATLEAAIRALAAGSKAQQQIATQERKLTALRKKRETQLSRLPDLADAVDLPEIDLSVALDAAGLESLQNASAAAERDFVDAETRHRRASMTQSQRNVYSQLRIVLQDAIDHGLADFPVARINEIPISVAQLASAIEEPAAAGDSRPAALDAARARWNALQELVDVQTSLHAFEADATTIEAAIESLKEGAPEQDDLQRAVQEARGSSDQALADHRRLTRRLGQLQASGAAETELAAAADAVARTLEAEGIEVDQLAGVLESVTAEHAARLSDMNAVQMDSQSLAETLARRDLARSRLRVRIHNGELDWLGADRGAVDDDGWWTSASVRARAASDLIAAIVDSVSGLAYGALHVEVDDPRTDALIDVVERHGLRDLSDPAIAEALFGDGKPLAVDLRKETVSWETKSGARLDKPLSTFSSGEQAMGFTRARLQQIADEPHPNRMVFLDEFGAFIAADRRHPLTELLREQKDGELGSQVVVVLPLQANYAGQLDEVSGGLRERYEARAAAVAQHGYFTEEFDE